MTRLRRTLATFVLALAPALPAAGGWAVQSLGRAEGLPSGQVHAVIQGTDGAMFFAGPSGLVRYDGARTEVFGPDHGLATQGLRALALAPDGTLWIGSDAGVDAWRPDGTTDSPIPPEAWSYGFVEDLAATADGDLWIASARGLLRWHPDDGLASAGDELPATLVTAVEAGGNGVIWAAGPAFGLWRRDGPRWRRVPDIAPSTLAAGADGAVLAGSEEGLVEVTPEGRTRPLLPVSGPVSAVLSLGAELWVADGQLRVYRRAGGRLAPAEVVLEAARVNQIVADAQDNVWWIRPRSTGSADGPTCACGLSSGTMPGSSKGRARRSSSTASGRSTPPSTRPGSSTSAACSSATGCAASTSTGRCRRR